MNKHEQADDLQNQQQGIIKNNGFAIAGFVISLVGIINPILGILGIILSVIGFIKYKKHPDVYKGKGFALAGLIIGIIDISLIVFLGLLEYDAWL